MAGPTNHRAVQDRVNLKERVEKLENREDVMTELYQRKYRCDFMWKGVEMSTYGSSKADFKNGFSVDDKLQLTEEENEVSWIPPSQLIRIEPEEVDG